HHRDDGAVVHARLAHQAAGNRQHQRPVRDRLAVGLLLAELPVDVRRVEVTREVGEVDDVGLRHRAARGAVALADLEVLEIEAAWRSLGHRYLPRPITWCACSLLGLPWSGLSRPSIRRLAPAL